MATGFSPLRVKKPRARKNIFAVVFAVIVGVIGVIFVLA